MMVVEWMLRSSSSSWSGDREGEDGTIKLVSVVIETGDPSNGVEIYLTSHP
jgi:hypothetical protein